MISVVIPAYNAQDTISACIKSVLEQTRSDLISEIIVVNDGSTDGTLDVIKTEIDSKLLKVISKSNGGVSSARNVGISYASSEWIALLDSDDIWVANKIEKQFEAIKLHPEILFIGANRNDENVRIGKRIHDKLYKLGLRDILFKTWPHTSTALINKCVFDDVGLFNENMKYAEDGNLWNRIVVKYPLYYIAESLEIAGGNKMAYGDSGLSANIQAMYKGNISNLKELRGKSELCCVEYLFWRFFFCVKYLKRIVVTNYVKFRRKAN